MSGKANATVNGLRVLVCEKDEEFDEYRIQWMTDYKPGWEGWVPADAVTLDPEPEPRFTVDEMHDRSGSYSVYDDGIRCATCPTKAAAQAVAGALNAHHGGDA